MIWYLILFVGYSCPGGILGGLIPDAARPLICRQEAKQEIYDPARFEKAKARIRELGESSVLFSCRGLKCKEIRVVWTTSARFEGEK